MRELVKNVVAAALYRSGLLRVLVARSLRNRGVVLMYHRVLPREAQRDSYSAAAIVVTPETFERHLEILAKYLKPVPPQEFLARLSDRATPLAGQCLLTFDDGWYDNYEYALPLLQRHGVPALIYVATHYIDSSNTFWQERLARMLHALWRARVTQADLYRELGVADLLAQSEQDVRRYVRAAISVMKSKSLAEINALTAQVAAVMQAHALGNHDLGCDRFMTWEQVERLHHSGVVTIGSHAQSHTPIPKLTAQAAATELRESQATIAQRLKFVTPWFAFPNGDFDQQSCELVAAAGYHMAVTTETGFVKSGDDPMRLCRLSIHEKAAPSPARLLCKLAGLF